MIRTTHLRVRNRGRLFVQLSCWTLLTCGTFAQAIAAQAQSSDGQGAPAASQSSPMAPSGSIAAGTTGAATPPATGQATPNRHQREAEDAYQAGAKKLEHGDLVAAENDFQRALKLDPENSRYAIAISVARQHRLTELVQQATKARDAGDQAKADSLFAEAKAMDPESPIVLEHSGAFLASSSKAQGNAAVAGGASSLLADRTAMLAGATGETNDQYWKTPLPALAGAIRLAPKAEAQSFDLRGSSAEVLRNVATAYGIKAVIDDSVEAKNVRFNLENVTYTQAMAILLQMAHAFAVPMTETSILIAKNDMPNRQRLERQLEETIDLPGYSTTELNDMSTVLKTMFDVKQITVQPGAENIVVRAPEAVMGPLNRTLGGLLVAGGEVMVEVKMYEVDTTRSTTAGATIPNGFGIYNVQAAAATLVSQNQSLVQQAIAQGLISATATNLEIAAALLESGLVQSTLLSSTIGIFGKGVAQTGITETGSVALNLGLNTSDTRQLDDIQQRVGDRQAATFREGTKYPIITSTYTTGLSTPASTLTNASINGVSLASLLAQSSGGSSATIPQVTYEDLGITLKATPIIQRSGRVNLTLDLKIDALSGSTSDGNPILDSRQFASVLTVADGDSALMVSDVNKTEMAAMTGVPGLNELPGFEVPLNDGLQNSSTQLVVMVTPHIIRMPRTMFAGPVVPVGPVATNQ